MMFMENFSNQMDDIKARLENVACDKQVKSPKVSVIVPTYNNDSYIAKCLFSLVEQTLKEIEIIVVNDGSTDNTASILEVFVQKDKRIKIITQANLKQGTARNNGMKIATGEYIGFVDSDDWVDLDYFEKLYNSAKKYNSDIALATNIRIGNGKTKKRLNIEKEVFVSSLQERIDISKQVKNPCPTNKIYRREMLFENKVTWTEGVYCEDKLFTMQALYYANGLVTVPAVSYYYFRNPNSTVNTKAKKRLINSPCDREKSKREVLDFLREKKADIRDKDFWALKKEYKFFNIPLFSVKESLRTERYYLFDFIKLGEKTYA